MSRNKVGEIVHSSFTVPHNQRLIYRVNKSFMYNEELKQKFQQFSKEEDEDTCRFLESCYTDQSLFKDMAATFLRNFMSLTDANGYTGRGEMFVCSWKQLKCLIPTLAEENNGDLLDIGAGDGNITAKIASHYNRIVTTESSTVMQKKLRARGWECYEPEAVPWNDMKYKFNLVMCLNVLDRADKPLTLLRDLRGMVKPGTGRLLLAVVLPWCAFVESGNKQMQPTEKLDMGNATCKGRATFEASFERIVEKNILPLGYELESWTRLPYISKGDVNSPYYTLSDAVLILRPVES
mmetsp:Transcript_8161/g.10330  ORF Transcript_8161/g.10330 Transcript_8161/m.10330 type:complete len:294 (+) Transcript_8161:164-1045(+)|eukprot:CAMPEP_0204828246 /NCGR_PEP_ID=MMETSP1346-20131115/5915_1 /ASSEMBLY_ACC=CAM_ASM_000771 /TAXON_ID=215587 /ORGANISM="Aplanochytrium stocchinoi, Strain GSBS06" /LENGTH=293 /DNA_ID=CAMNT_0051957153 /DNA_START=80 /DNA_END=961 /DNA_ORIENTATION=-